MDSALTTVGLPLALGIIMFGLGLSLTVADFRRVAQHPKVMVIALGCQLILLPLVCFGLVIVFDLPPLLAVGMMLLAASPGGTSANLFSHLFRGDVALNVSLTAVNSVISIVSLPLITNIAIDYFELDDSVGLQFVKVLEVFAIVLVPVAIGMLVRAKASSFAERMDRPVRIGSAVILAILVVGILASEAENVSGYLGDVGLVAALFCAISLVTGYAVPARRRRPRRPGHRHLDGDRRPQRHPGDLRRPRGPRLPDQGPAGAGRCSRRRLLDHHVRVRGALGLLHQPTAGQVGRSRAATCGASCLSARPRWLIASLSGTDSSAVVTPGRSSASNTTS